MSVFKKRGRFPTTARLFHDWWRWWSGVSRWFWGWFKGLGTGAWRPLFFGPRGRRTIRVGGKKYLIVDSAETASYLLNKPGFLEKLKGKGYDQIIIASSGQAIDVSTGEVTKPDLDLVPAGGTRTTETAPATPKAPKTPKAPEAPAAPKAEAGGRRTAAVKTKRAWAPTTDPLRQLLGDDLYFAFKDLRGQKYVKPWEWQSNWAQAREKWKHGDIADFAWMKLHEMGEVPPEVSSALKNYIQNPNDSTAKTLLDKLRPYADDTGDYRNLIEGYWAVGEAPPADLVETFKAEMAKVSPHWNRKVPEYYAKKWAADRGLPWEVVKDWTYGDWLMYDSFARIYGLQRGGAYGEPVITSKLGYSVDEVLNMFEQWYHPGGGGEVYYPTTAPSSELPSPPPPPTIESAHPPTPPRGTVYRPGELSGGVSGRQATMGVKPVSTGYRSQREKEIMERPVPPMPPTSPRPRLGRRGGGSTRTSTRTPSTVTGKPVPSRPSTPTPRAPSRPITPTPRMPEKSPSARLSRRGVTRKSPSGRTAYPISSSRSSSRSSRSRMPRPRGGAR